MDANKVRRLLRRHQGELSIREFAALWNMDHGYLHRIISGKREPNDDVLANLGLEKVTTYRTIKSNGKC